MNTKNSKQDQNKNQVPKTRQGQEPKKHGRPGQNGGKIFEHEYPEMRLTR